MRRRTFLKCLLGGSALVAAPVLLDLAKSDAQRQTDLWDLLDLKSRRGKVVMLQTKWYKDDLAGSLYRTFMESANPPDVILAGRYQYQQVVGQITVTA